MIVSVGLDETMSKNVKEFSKILVKQKWAWMQTNFCSCPQNRAQVAIVKEAMKFGASTILAMIFKALLVAPNSCWVFRVAKQLPLMVPNFKNLVQKTKISRAKQAHRLIKNKTVLASCLRTSNSQPQGKILPINNWKIKINLAASEFQRQLIRFLRILVKWMKLE